MCVIIYLSFSISSFSAYVCPYSEFLKGSILFSFEKNSVTLCIFDWRSFNLFPFKVPFIQ